MKVSMNSYQQLKKDFIRFPEEHVPHDDYLSSVSFDVVTYNRVRRFWIATCFFGNQLTESILGYYKNTRGLLIFLQMLFIVPLLPVLTVIFLYLSIVSIYRIDCYLRKLGGLYNKKLSGSVIYVSNRLEPVQYQEMTVSHEHIHFLQAIASGESDKINNDLPIENSFSWLLSPEGHQSKKIKYLMQRHETEARLHEVVVHYARQGFQLPLSVSCFLEMLSKFTWLNVLTVDSNNEQLVDAGFVTRCEQVDTDIFNIFSALNTEYVREYVRFVLPVMYANLLGYYGYKETKELLLNSIDNFDLYIKLYGSGGLQVSKFKQ